MMINFLQLIWTTLFLLAGAVLGEEDTKIDCFKLAEEGHCMSNREFVSKEYMYDPFLISLTYIFIIPLA